MRWLPILCLLCGLLAGQLVWAEAPARPHVNALRVPDGAITIDGADDDWRLLGKPLERCQFTADNPKNWAFGNTDRGTYAGKDDCSFTGWLATDSKFLYILADVHDQLLINTAGAENAYCGDDFEVFIDAGTPEQRFAAKRGENAHQCIFLPAHVNAAFPDGLIWHAKDNPGVKMASRLRPWGYTIEVAIPKALFPNWVAHPDMDSVAFDLQVTDADAPGVDWMHPALKGDLLLLSPAPHFQSSEKLGVLTLESAVTPQPTVQRMGVRPPSIPVMDALFKDKKIKDTLKAQVLLDCVGMPYVGRFAAMAVASPAPILRKAGVEVFALRSEISAPVPALQAMLAPAPGPEPLPDADLRTYALMALAERKQCPLAKYFDLYATASDNALRLTVVWCAGVNGDHAMVPKLLALLTNTNLRVRLMAAISLGALGDPAALPALHKMMDSDPHQYGRGQAKNAIEQIEKAGKK